MKRNLNGGGIESKLQRSGFGNLVPAIDELVCTTRNCLAVRETADLDGAYE